MLSLRQLEVLRAVMRLRTTVGAAKEVGLSQPAISNGIRAMEATLGFRLFDRIGNRLVPTEEANDLYQGCDPLFLHLQAVRQQAADLRSGRAGRLRLAVTAELADSLLPQAMRHFAQRHSGVRVAIEIRGMTDMLDGLDSGATHLALGLALDERPGIALHRLAEVEMLCAAPRGSALEALAAVTPAELAGIPLIAAPEGSRIHALVADAFRRHGTAFAPSIEIRFMNAAIRLVEQGLGATITDPLTAAGRDVVTRPFRPAIPIGLSAASARERPMPRLAQAFLAAVREALALSQAAAAAEASMPAS